MLKFRLFHASIYLFFDLKINYGHGRRKYPRFVDFFKFIIWGNVLHYLFSQWLFQIKIWGQETHERYLQNNKSAHSKKWVRFLHISSHFWIFLKFENYVYQFHILIFHNLPIPASHMRCQRPGLLPMSVPAKLEVGKDRFASCQLKTPWWNLKVPVNGQVVRRGRT